jgi:hypothetical protein
MKRVVLLAVVSCLFAGVMGCASAPQYAENSEVSWEVFYSVRTKPYETFVSDSRNLPTTFFIGGFIVGHDSNSDYAVISISNTEQGSEKREIFCSVRYTLRKDFQTRFESGKKYQFQIEKKYPTWTLVGIDGVSLNEIVAELQSTEAERQSLATEERNQRAEERQQPRFSPEGNEYIKRTLIQAVGESRNQANRGKTLFFESSEIRLRNTGATGQYLVDEMRSDGSVIMEFYNRIPSSNSLDPIAIVNRYGYIILYRVEINQLGIASFKIDSFK